MVFKGDVITLILQGILSGILEFEAKVQRTFKRYLKGDYDVWPL